MDSVSESRLQKVCPVLSEKVQRLAAILEQEGIVIRVTQGLRTWAEQDALYAQGRATPGKVVTNCRGGYSYHNFGLAVDVVPDVDGRDATFQPDWNTAHPSWRRIVAVAVKLGLDSGAMWKSFKDYPHLQLTGRFPESAPTDDVRRVFKAGGLQAVWHSAELLKEGDGERA
jgi:peptidoglycan L-alanyl-D-glutamate endopeptidase CwlK